MSHTGAKLILLVSLGSLFCRGQSSSTASPTSPPPLASEPSAPLPPSSPDMPIPNPATFPKHEDGTKSSTKRVVERLTPLCVDWMFHSCLFTGNGDLSPTDETEREFTKNFEVGETYLQGKNYKAAESRFREALQYKPDHPGATYKLAVSVDKLGKTDEAMALYDKYLKMLPSGPYADQARKALRKKTASASR